VSSYEAFVFNGQSIFLTVISYQAEFRQILPSFHGLTLMNTFHHQHNIRFKDRHQERGSHPRSDADGPCYLMVWSQKASTDVLSDLQSGLEQYIAATCGGNPALPQSLKVMAARCIWGSGGCIGRSFV